MTAAAEAAVLAGVRAGSQAASDGTQDWNARARQVANSIFLSNVDGQGISDFTFSPTFTRVGTAVEGEATYSYSNPTSLMHFFGLDTVQLGHSPKARMVGNNYIDIGFLIDNSGSMGIGATPADQKKMAAANPAGCAFACHVPRTANEESMTPEQAHALAGVKLRIDVARQALIDSIKSIQSKVVTGDQVRVAVYSFSNKVEMVIEPTTDLDQVLAKVSEIELARSANVDDPAGGSYVSYSVDALADILSKFGVPGDGSSRLRRQSYVVLLTDGIDDSTAVALDKDKVEQEKNKGSRAKSDAGLLGKLLVALNTGAKGAPVENLVQQLLGPLFSSLIDALGNFLLGPGWTKWMRADALDLRKTAKSTDPKLDGSILQPFDPKSCQKLKDAGRLIYTLRMEHSAQQGGLRKASGLQPYDIAKLDYLDAKVEELQKSTELCSSNPSMALTADRSEDIPPTLQSIIDSIMPGGEAKLTY